MASSLSRSAMARRALRYGVPALLMALVLITFRGVLGHDFVAWDDEANILKNPHVNGLSSETLWWLLTDTSYAPRYMPLGWLVYAVNRQMFGLDPQLWHAGNLFLHLTNTVLLFVLLRKLVSIASLQRNRQAGDETISTSCAAMGALIWAVNPLRVEVVSWSSCCIYNVAFLFGMVWILAWVHGRTLEAGAGQRALAWLSLAAFAACLLTYPIAIFGPALLFVLDLYPLRRLSPTVGTWSFRNLLPLVREKVPFVVVSLAILGITAFARLGGGRSRPVSWEEFGLVERLVQAGYTLAYYAWKPFWPTSLSASYPTLHAFNPLDWKFLAMGIAIAGSGVAVLCFARRNPLALALWLCHVAILVPVLGLSEYPHATYDRYSHFHSILWSGIIAMGLAAGWRRHGRYPRVLFGGAFAACLIFAVLSLRQVPVWKNTLMLYQNIVARHGDHPSRGRFDEVLGDRYLSAGLTNEAIASFTRAAHFDSLRKDRHIYDEGVAARSETRLAKLSLAAGDLESAAAHYLAALKAEQVAVHAVPRTIEAVALLIRLNRAPEALPLLRKALETAPRKAALHQQLGVVLQQLGRETEARAHFDEEHRLRTAALQAKTES